MTREQSLRRMLRAALAVLFAGATFTLVAVRTDRARPPTTSSTDAVTVTGTYGPDPVANSYVLHLPSSEDSRPRPLLVFVHGGGFVLRPSGTIAPEILRALADEGWAVAQIFYRLAPQHSAPAQVEDVTRAVRWLKANAPQFNIDKDRVVLAGHSAGGLLALVAGLSCSAIDSETTCARPLQPPRVTKDLEAVDSTVRAIVAIAPVIDLSVWSGMSETANLVTGMLLGCHPPTACNSATAEQMSPRHWIDSSDPPVMVLLGSKDRNVDARDTARGLIDDLLPHEPGSRSRLVVVDDADHSSILSTDGAPILRFLGDVGV